MKKKIKEAHEAQNYPAVPEATVRPETKRIRIFAPEHWAAPMPTINDQ